MQPYQENDIATAVERALIDSSQGPKGMLLHTVFSFLPSLTLIAHHTYSYSRLLGQVKLQ